MATRGYQQVLGSATAVTNASSSTWVDQCTASFALDASSTYLILGYMEGQVNNTTAADGQYRLYDGTTALCSSNARHISSDASEWIGVNLCALITTTSAATPTLALQAKLSGTASSRLVSTRNGVIFAIKLGANDVSMTNDLSGTSTANPGAFTDYAPASGTSTLTFTPGTTGDYLIIAFATTTYSAAADGAQVALLCEDASTRVVNSYWVPASSGNKVSWAGIVKRTGLTAVSQTFKIQHARQRSATGTSTVDQVRMVALRLSDFDSSNVTQDTTSRTTTSASYVDLGTTQADTLTNAIDYLFLGSYWEGTNNNAILHSAKMTDGTTAYNESQRKENFHAGEPNWGQAILVPRKITGAGSSVTHKLQGKITSVLTLTSTEHRLAILQLQASGADASVTVPAAVAAVSSVPWTTITGQMGTLRPAAAISTTWLYDTSGNPVMWDSGTHVMAPSGGAQPTIGLTFTTLTAPAVSAVGTPTINFSTGAPALVAAAVSAVGTPTIGLTWTTLRAAAVSAVGTPSIGITTTGMRAAATSAVGTPTISMSGPFSDNFNRANGPVANSWTTAFGSLTYGDASIVSNELSIPPGSLNSRGFVYRNFGTADGTFTVHRDGYLGQGMILRYQDSLNFIYIDSVSLVVWVDGGGTGTVSYTVGSGLDLKVVLAGSSIKASSDGTNNWSVDITDTHFQTATIHGIWGGAAGPPSATFDNFAYTPDVDVPALVAAAVSAVGTPTISTTGNPAALVAAAVSSVGTPTISTTAGAPDLVAAAVSAVGTPTISTTKTADLIDTFDTAINSPPWRYNNLATVVGGRARFEVRSDYGSGMHTDTDVYDLTNSHYFFQAFPDPSTTSTRQLILQLLDHESSSVLQIGKAGGGLALENTGSNPAVDYVGYDATNDAWWQIRADNTNVYWETSPDGSTWTTLRTKSFVTLGWKPTSVRPAVTVGYYGTETTPFYVYVDNVNTVVPAITGAAAVSSVGTPTITASGQPAALVAAAISAAGSPTITASATVSTFVGPWIYDTSGDPVLAFDGSHVTWADRAGAAWSAAATFPSGVIGLGASATAQVAAASSAVGTPTISATSQPTPTVAAAVSGVGTPTLQSGSDISVSAQVAAAVSSVPAVGISVSITATGAPATSAVGTPTISATGSPTALVAAAVSSVGTPTLTASGNATATGAPAVSSVGTPTISTSASVAGSAPATSAVGTPTLSASADVTASGAGASSGAAWAGYGLTYGGMTATAVSGVGTPTISAAAAGTNVTPTTAAAVSSVGTARIGVTAASMTAAAISAVGTLGISVSLTALTAVALSRVGSGTNPSIITTKADTIVDAFEVGIIASPPWRTATGTDVNAGRARMAVTSSYSSTLDTGTEVYDLIASHAWAKVTPDPANNTRQSSFYAIQAGLGRLQFTKSGTTLTLEVAGTGANASLITYDPVAHAWWQFRVDVATVYWETSPDGSTWTIRKQLPLSTIGWKPTSVRIGFNVGYFGVESTPSYTYVDNVNIITAPAQTAVAISGVGMPTSVGGPVEGPQPLPVRAVSGVGAPTITANAVASAQRALAASAPGSFTFVTASATVHPTTAAAHSAVGTPTFILGHDETVHPTTAAAISAVGLPQPSVVVFPLTAPATSVAASPTISATGNAFAQRAISISSIGNLLAVDTAKPPAQTARAVSGVGVLTFIATAFAPAQRAIAISTAAGPPIWVQHGAFIPGIRTRLTLTSPTATRVRITPIRTAVALTKPAVLTQVE